LHADLQLIWRWINVNVYLIATGWGGRDDITP